MKYIILMLLMTTAVNSSDWVTTINHLIYETPLPKGCDKCTVEFVEIHPVDRWVQLKSIALNHEANFINNTSGWVTTIDGLIYETPIPADCPGCTVEFVQIHPIDKWVQLRTDRIFYNGFE